MTWRNVKQQDWQIRGPDNQPQKGFLVTIQDDVTGDSFNIEVPSLDDFVVDQAVRKHLDKLKSSSELSWE